MMKSIIILIVLLAISCPAY
ncbi:type I toxin-antitoxin system Ibs family toxin [Salmonella enterica]|nr:type I toxin-antitoxin system Ibs family toxin [Salmonella enterica subsp. enterica serovar Rissen]EEJ6876523.1 type I toxin-antitoxin system Ibs family toxin [Salmonella enterica subsp. houtenae]EHA2158766.1 type I toxin-antitoxin system Ibs family toxin [Salmonella enterica]